MSDQSQTDASAQRSDDRRLTVTERHPEHPEREHRRRLGQGLSPRPPATDRSPEWPFGATPDERGPVRSAEASGSPAGESRSSRPDVDIVEHANEIHVWCDLPGCTADSIDLSGDEWTLYVTGERADEYWEGDLIYHRERSETAERAISLPARSDIGDAEATYDDGVLFVRAPKHESERTQEITVR